MSGLFNRLLIMAAMQTYKENVTRITTYGIQFPKVIPHHQTNRTKLTAVLLGLVGENPNLFM